MTAHATRRLLTGFMALTQSACGIIGPSCVDLDEVLMTTIAQVEAGASRSFDVISAQHSNLVMRLSWSDHGAVLGMRASMTSCGEHLGCLMDTLVPSFGPGGPSPTPQPWPAGTLEIQGDGTRGKAYRIDIIGDPARAAEFTLQVNYHAACES
jgi:hypothetical protein